MRKLSIIVSLICFTSLFSMESENDLDMLALAGYNNATSQSIKRLCNVFLTELDPLYNNSRVSQNWLTNKQKELTQLQSTIETRSNADILTVLAATACDIAQLSAELKLTYESRDLCYQTLGNIVCLLHKKDEARKEIETSTAAKDK